MIVNLNKLKSPNAGWQPVGSLVPEERIWRFCSVNPMPAKDKKPQQSGGILPDMALPAGMEHWINPEFDDSKWTSGRSPIGVGIYRATGHGNGYTATPTFSFKNNSDWGAGEFLLARLAFDVKDPDFDYYRIRILTNKESHIYLNGHHVGRSVGGSFPAYSPFMLGAKEISYLRKGRNTLAVQSNMAYPMDKKTEKQLPPIGQMDLVFECLRKKDIGLAEGATTKAKK
jgi:hypothetical protein